MAWAGADAARSPCVLQIFEWWYFRKYGTSFIEQVSVSHLRPLLGGVDNSAPSAASAANGDADSSRQSVSGEGQRGGPRPSRRRRQLPPLPRLSKRREGEARLLTVPAPGSLGRSGPASPGTGRGSGLLAEPQPLRAGRQPSCPGTPRVYLSPGCPRSASARVCGGSGSQACLGPPATGPPYKCRLRRAVRPDKEGCL